MNAINSNSWARKAALVIAALLPVCASEATIVLQLSGTRTMAFDGQSGFYFVPNTSGDEFKIVGSTGGTGDAKYLRGTFGSTVWHFESDGTVTGTGQLLIKDGSTPFTADVRWVTISSYQGIGGLDSRLVVNVSGMNYDGTKKDLLALESAGSAILNVSFQTGGLTVDQLKDATIKPSFSATLTSVPEASTVLAGLGAIGMLAWAGLRRRSA